MVSPNQSENALKKDAEGYNDLIRSEAGAAVKKYPIILIFFVGVMLIIVGQLSLTFSQESTEDIVHIVLAQQAAPGSYQRSDDGGDAGLCARVWGFIDSRAFGQMMAELSVRFGELAVIGVSLEFLLHSEHYAKFFLHLIEEAVMGDRVVRRLGNSQHLWTKVSEVYFRQKFPKIHKALSATLYKYFPVEHTYYLDDYRIRYDIKSIPNGNYIKMFQEISYVIIPASAEEVTPFKFGVAIYKNGSSDNLTSAKTVGFRVGNEDFTAKAAFKEKDIGGKRALELDFQDSVKGESDYRTTIQIELTWDILFDPNEIFTVHSLVNDLRVSVDFTEDLDVEWCEIGVFGRFIDLFPGNLTSTKIDKQYSGLVFHNQGYRLVIRKKGDDPCESIFSEKKPTVNAEAVVTSSPAVGENPVPPSSDSLLAFKLDLPPDGSVGPSK